jgi:hypothetical protein
MKVNTIMVELVECERREKGFVEARKHYARMVRREREKRKALLALLDQEEARRGAAGRVCEEKRNTMNLPHSGGRVKRKGGAE